jgi:ParB family transcriptional regulator, chromosome partitioning protein
MVKRAPARRRPRKAKPGTKGLGPAECRLEQPTGAAAEAARAIEKAGGCVVGLYKEPLGGHPVLLAILPIDAVEPTRFQRDLSDDRSGFPAMLERMRRVLHRDDNRPVFQIVQFPPAR